MISSEEVSTLENASLPAPEEMRVQVLPTRVLATIGELKASRRNETLTSRLQSNDPSLTHLKLTRRPISLFDDFSHFLQALRANKTVKSVEFCWRFLSMLSEPARVELMDCVGVLPSLEKLFLEAMGPCYALTAAVEKASKLKTLWVGSLRISSYRDIERLAAAFRSNQTLYQVSLSNIKIPAQGSHRVDEEGMVWFQENEYDESAEKLDLNPLVEALSSVPTLKKIQMELQLNPEKMKPLSEDSIRRLCQSPRIYLMVNACGLEDNHCLALSKELCGNACVLEDLMISRNRGITSVGWAALAAMTETNYCLSGLYTPSDPALAPKAQYRIKMDFYLRLNRAGRKKLLSDPNTTRDDWLKFVAREGNDISMVFYALLVAPDLFISYYRS